MIGKGPAAARVLDGAGGGAAMAAVSAATLFLTVLAAAAGLAALNASARVDRRLAGRLDIQLVDGDPVARDRGAAAVVATLRAVPGVARARAVPRAELEQLLRPWLGRDAGGLPVPALVEAELADPAAVGPARAAALRAAPAARIDPQARWMAPVSQLMHGVAGLAGVLVAVAAGATLAAVALAVRGGLDRHRTTVELLHLLGCTDRQLARLFRRRVGRDALIGGSLGGVAAMLTAWMLGGRFAGLGSDLIGGGGLSSGDWLVLALLPPAFAGAAALAAGRAVLARLARTL